MMMFRFSTVYFHLAYILCGALCPHLAIVSIQASPWSLPKFCSRVWMWPVSVLAALLLPEGRSRSGGGGWSAGAVSNPIFRFLSLIFF